MAVASDAFDGVFLCCSFYYEMSWIRSGTQLSQFLRVFLPTLYMNFVQTVNRDYILSIVGAN